VTFKAEHCDPCSSQIPLAEGDVFVDSNALGATPVYTHEFDSGVYVSDDVVTVPKEILQALDPGTIHYLIVQSEMPYPKQPGSARYLDATNEGALLVPFAVAPG
jgi:hypothetical protein